MRPNGGKRKPARLGPRRCHPERQVAALVTHDDRDAMPSSRLDGNDEMRRELGELPGAGREVGRTAGIHRCLELRDLTPVVVFYRGLYGDGAVGLLPADADPDREGEPELTRDRGERERVPSSAHEVELSGDDLGVIGDQCVFDVHAAIVGTWRCGLPRGRAEKWQNRDLV